ncbi:VCBS repeat-containing protein [Flagellimonas halotolerans]|uniref:VCBS repeat-containing protein n=1 Tax=Flagellimonas halotolerans TaxID=3112164 RepID=A0ABU6IT22_9FLAO|nr:MULTISPECIES: VCBS repeat-containing protein [unclassified Allomuricauda]MEC3966211.1 VCBS repeat-containing protein [Muricauda sp. SYSU M86414]MEC4266103.1 VCBS repeat-containing protein [Muricauda sp. SYSU M84420]
MRLSPIFRIIPYRALVLLYMTLFLVGCGDDGTLFMARTPGQTGIHFSNKLNLSDELSVLEFEYMYNGAGVAVADFDLDGLQDIYFTANMSSNALYKNLGDWKFEDVTLNSNTSTSNWSNGVAIVDINQDSYPDIYVSCGGPRGSSGQARKNLLFINNAGSGKGLTFTESAAEWGLDYEGYSIQAAFFDYDRDGDLDMYLLNNALVDYNRNTARPIDISGKVASTDKLYRNNGNNTFTDVSKDANILIEGFGLGVQICDMNRDGWPDIYVSNDFLTNDLLYVNQKDGTFRNELADYFEHHTFNGMGNDIADINNDGFMDVVVLDMLPEDNKRWKLTMMGNKYDEFQEWLSYGYRPQYIRNTLQLNNGNGSFSEVGQLMGISATEWSWSPLFADFDQDGLRDLYVTNGYRQDITNLDFMVYGNRVLTMGTEEANRKARLEELNKLPGIKIKNYMYRNTGELGFENTTDKAGFDMPTYSNGAAYADLDNDGDLDLVINNIDDPAGVYQNQSERNTASNFIKFKFKGKPNNRDGIGSHLEIRYGDKKQVGYHTPYRGYLSSVEQGLHFGLGNTQVIDTVIVTWPDGKKQLLKNLAANKVYQLDESKASQAIALERTMPKETSLFVRKDTSFLSHHHKEDKFVDYKVQPLLQHMHSKNGPGISVGDVNGDHLEDFYIGGAAGQAGTLMIQQEDGKFVEQEFQDSQYEDMGALFFDVENDGDQDLYVVSGGSSFGKDSGLYRDRVYLNDGSGNFLKNDILPPNATSGSVVAGADYNRDGYMDLFVGGRVRPGEYPLTPKSMLLQNKGGTGEFKFVEDPKNTALKELGMVTAALWTDIDNDDWIDLIVVGEFMPVRIFKNNRGSLMELSNEHGLENSYGWWNSISAGDFDSDGDMDYILGNFGLNNRFEVSESEPLRIYAKDFDNNGLIDPVMSCYINGENYAVHSRNDLIKQINAMRGRFRTYTDYAEAPFSETFLKEELEDAVVFRCEQFANSYLENLGNGKFKLRALPKIAQIAPMYGTHVGDYDQDGNLDILSVGNFYSGEVFAGRYDASKGWFLAGDGKGNFTSVDFRESGFFLKGDAKSLVNIHIGDQELVLSGINNGPLAIFQHQGKNRKRYYPTDDEIGALVTYWDGRVQRFEFGRASGYLSQSSRAFALPEGASSIMVIDQLGNKHEIMRIQ